MTYSPTIGHGTSCYPCETAKTTGSIACDGCDAGKYKVNDDCQDCQLGKFTSIRNQRGCSACPRGQYTNLIGQSKCLNCPRGRHGGKTGGETMDSSCTKCDVGRYSDLEGLVTSENACVGCETGKYSQIEGADKESLCLFCGPGRYCTETSASSAIACKLCSLGKFSQAVGAKNSSACTSCPAGYSQSDEGMAYCLPCQPGSSNNIEGAVRCKLCAINLFAENSKQSICTVCSVGRYTSKPGAAVCIECAPGRYGLGCLNCPAGFFRSDNSSTLDKCDRCGHGDTSRIGSSSCLECGKQLRIIIVLLFSSIFNINKSLTIDFYFFDFIFIDCILGRGQYGIATNHGTCGICPNGWSQELIGKVLCTECEIGTSFSKPGNPCTACRPGLFGSEKGVCTDCPKGFVTTDPEQVGCTQCAAGKKYDSPSFPCASCAAGRFGNEPGSCAECAAGFYQDLQEKTSCNACSKDHYLIETEAKSKGDCKRCEIDYAPYTSTGGQTGVADPTVGCICAGALDENGETKDTKHPEGFYTTPEPDFSLELTKKDASARLLCIKCPSGANCEASGTTVGMLSAKVGFYRHTPTSKIFANCANGYSSGDDKNKLLAEERCCPIDSKTNQSVCKNMNGSMLGSKCKVGYRGPLCRGCDTALNYVARENGQSCELCIGGPSILSAIMTVGGICLLLFITMVVVLKLFIKDRHANEKADKKAKTFGQIKLLVSFLQILSSMPVTFSSVPWPENFKMFAINLEFINLDFLGVLIGPNTCGLSLPALDQLLVHSLVPPMLFAACLCAYYVARVLNMNNGTKENRKLLKAIHWETTVKLLIFIMLLLYPGIANRSFSMWRCQVVNGIDGRMILASDWNFYCHEGLHAERLFIGMACLIVYVLGTPLFIFGILFKNRKHLWDLNSPKHAGVKTELGGLYQQYEPKFWWFELVVISNKMMMTGGLSVVEPGSPVQLVLALLTMQSLLLITLKLGPFESFMDDVVAFLSSMALSLTTLGGLALIMDDEEEPAFNASMVGIGIIVVCSSVSVITVGNVILNECGLYQKSKKIARSISKKIHLTQVVPDGEGVSQVSHEDHEELKNCHKTTKNENEQLKDKIVLTTNENEQLKDKVVRLEAILRVQEDSRPNQPSERHVVEKQTGVRLFK